MVQTEVLFCIYLPFRLSEDSSCAKSVAFWQDRKLRTERCFECHWPVHEKYFVAMTRIQNILRTTRKCAVIWMAAVTRISKVVAVYCRKSCVSSIILILVTFRNRSISKAKL